MPAAKPTRSLLTKLVYFFGAAWATTIAIFLSSLAVATRFFSLTPNQGPLRGDTWLTVVGIDILASIFFFFVFLLVSFIWSIKHSRHQSNERTSRPRRFWSFAWWLLTMPIAVVFKIWRPTKTQSQRSRKKLALSSQVKNNFKKVLLTLPALILIALWLTSYAAVGAFTKSLVYHRLGFVSEGIPVAGTGSMYPTFAKGEGKDQIELAKQVVGTPGMFPYPNGLVLFGKRYFGHQLGRGDIIVVEDDKTRKITEETYGRASGWVKRIVAVAGDTLEIRDGIVYLNHEPLKEPYLAKPRSTFGQTFLQECQEITVPENSIFVMGDNRTGSGDSREVGFFKIDDVNHALPLADQTGDLVDQWRDTTNDLEETARIKIDTEQYLELLNKERTAAGVKPLQYDPKLEESATKRGEVILKYDDFSFEATRSGYTMAKAMREVGYGNTVWGEAPLSGYYEADELLENQFEFPESKKFLLDKQYQDIGIAEVRAEVNGCPKHLIVQHFGGYVPPNYPRDVISSWEGALGSLRSIQSSWNELRSSGDFYNQNKSQVDRMNQIIEIRINRMADVVGTMRANRWLSASQESYVEHEDYALAREQNELANYLNGR